MRPFNAHNVGSWCRLIFIGVLLGQLIVVAASSESKGDKSDSAQSAQTKGSKAIPAVGSVVSTQAVTKLPKRATTINKDEMLKKDPWGKYVQKEGNWDIGFIHAFVASLSVIIVSELGDKTFFIAAIMAMRHPRLTVFTGAVMALGIMTILSAVLGYATTVIPRWLTYYVSSGLFAIFGLKMLKEGYYMGADEGQEEYEEVKEELRKKDEEAEQGDVETGRFPQRKILFNMFSRVFLQSLTLTFLAEWGDRSQIATIILGAREDVVGVIIGGTLGHALCTGLAVLGGRFIAQRISIS